MKSLFTLFFLSSLVLPAQQSIKGKLLDEQNIPIPFATIALYSNTPKTLVKAGATDLDGLFELENIQTGPYTLEISYVGYTTLTQTLQVVNAPINLANLTLTPSVAKLQEIQIEALRPIVEIKPDKTVFNVEGTINASGSDALELLRKAPGVLIDNNNNVALKGKQGVQVYLNNKPSQMTGDDLAAFLESLNAEQIAHIEIISNPSARYDAAGGAGIINIILKKEKKENANALINAGIQQGYYPKYNGSITSNYKKNKLNIYSNIGYRDGKRRSFNNSERVQNLSKIQSNNVNVRDGASYNLKLGADYTLHPFHTIGFLVDGGLHKNNSNEQENSLLGVSNFDYSTNLASNTLDTKDRNVQNYNLNYIFKDTNNHVLSLDLDYSTRSIDNLLNQTNTFSSIASGAQNSINNIKNDRTTDITIKSIKSDFETPLNQGTFSTGVKASTVNTANNFLFYDVDANNQSTLNTNQTNAFEYQETVLAAYAQYLKTFNKINASFGLRAEHTITNGLLQTLNNQNQSIDRNYLNLFPSIGFSYPLSPKTIVGINYSKRIDRPSFRNLNPFTYQVSSISTKSGNPFLLPEFTDVFEITHSYNRFLNTALSYSHTTNLISDVVLASDSNSIDEKPLNLNSQKIFNISTSAVIPLSKKMNTYLSLSASHTTNQSAVDSINNINISATVGNLYVQNTLSLPKGYKLEISGNVSSPGIWRGNMKYNWQGTLDLGLQKKLLQDRATLKLSITDILGTNGWRISSNTGVLAFNGNGNWESQQIRLNFTYILGNTKMKAKNKKTGLDDEDKRSGE